MTTLQIVLLSIAVLVAVVLLGFTCGYVAFLIWKQKHYPKTKKHKPEPLPKCQGCSGKEYDYCLRWCDRKKKELDSLDA